MDGRIDAASAGTPDRCGEEEGELEIKAFDLPASPVAMSFG